MADVMIPMTELQSNGQSVSSPTTANTSHHRKTMSLWSPPTAPIIETTMERIKPNTLWHLITQLLVRLHLMTSIDDCNQHRDIIPNHRPLSMPRYRHPNYRKFANNRIVTAKYSLFTFLPKNLFEQFHRLANIYFLVIIGLNWIPAVEAFSRVLGIIPVTLILSLTAIKDLYEDFRRHRSDSKINTSICHVWDSESSRFRRLQWQHVLVGDFVHLSCNEVIPADILLIRSSEAEGCAYVETSNLDGETSLKQRYVLASMTRYSGENNTFTPTDFTASIRCELPNNQIYRMQGRVLHDDGQVEPISFDNMLLRGCMTRNTTFVEGIVIYAGPRYKRSTLERLTNRFILFCVAILIILCLTGGIGSFVWMKSYNDFKLADFLPSMDSSPVVESLISILAFIVTYQVLIPLSLYISIELIKLGQIYFITQDIELYYEKVDKRIECRALNIPEELGQIQYVVTDKTGTLTDNVMIFRRCSIAGRDYGSSSETAVDDVGCISIDTQLQQAIANSDIESDTIQFMIAMAICNTVVVNRRPHFDETLENDGFISADGTFNTGNSAFHIIASTNGGQQHQQLPPIRSLSHTISVRVPSRHCRRLTAPSNFSFDYGINVTTPKSIDFSPIVDETSPPIDTYGNGISPTEGPLLVKPTVIDIPANELEISCIAESSASFNSKSEPDDSGMEPTPPPSSSFSPIASFSQKFARINRNMIRDPVSKIRTGIANITALVTSSMTTASVDPSDETDDPRAPIYEAESPDELSLVNAAAAYGVRLIDRRPQLIVIRVVADQRRVAFHLLHVLPFDANRKRMSIVVRANDPPRHIMLYCKGADSAIFDRLSDEYLNSAKGFPDGCLYEKFTGSETMRKCRQHLNSYATSGYRTLCLARRRLSADEYDQWSRDQNATESAIAEDRDDQLAELADRIERNLELLGVTAVEDRLQENVEECIEAMRQANITVWVLTGDKWETAINVANLCRLFNADMRIVNLHADTEMEICEKLRAEADETDLDVIGSSKTGLVLTGDVLRVVTRTDTDQDRLVRVLERCTSVLCCRVTPLEKAQVVKLIKCQLHGKVLAIGDGANDVSMIQSADVGVGISGQEGMQAVMASDFSLARFHFLRRLLFVHGHWCYDRLARTFLYFLYKNAVFVFVIFWCQFFNGYSAQSPMDPIYSMLYSIIFTSIPPLVYGIYEQNAPASVLYASPRLYNVCNNGQLYRSHLFVYNMIDALWQSLVIYFIAHLVYTDTDDGIWSFGFLLCSSLFFVNNVHLAIECRSWTWPMCTSILVSTFLHFAFFLIYGWLVTAGVNVKNTPRLIAEHDLISVRYWTALLLTIVVAVLPRFLAHLFLNTFRPSPVLIDRQR